VTAQVGRDHVNAIQSRPNTNEAQSVGLDAMQAQERPAASKLLHEQG
jgi:hypothetical protein